MTQNLRIQDLDCRVDAHREAGAHLRLITFRPQGDQALTARAWLPGQFVMIDPPTPTFLLRRPMSVMRVHDDGRFDVFYKVHGKGTALMARLAPGDAVRVLGPLGRHFTIETPSSGQPESAPERCSSEAASALRHWRCSPMRWRRRVIRRRCAAMAYAAPLKLAF